jgi:hypothetical protein
MLLKDMKDLYGKGQEKHVIRVWSVYVQLLGKVRNQLSVVLVCNDFGLQTLHRGTLINKVLTVIESGFKHSSPDILIAAYTAWRDLIDTFALDLGL